MEKKKLTGFLVDPYKRLAVPMTIDGDLDSLYAAMGVDCIDIVERTIAGKLFTIVCDDEGLLKDKPIPSATSKSNTVMLVGPLFVCNDGGSDLASLTPADVKFIKRNLGVAIVPGHGMSPVLRHVGY